MREVRNLRGKWVIDLWNYSTQITGTNFSFIFSSNQNSGLARMMDSLILDSLSTPYALTKITTHRPMKKATSTQNLPSNSNTTLRAGFNGNSGLKKIPTQGKNDWWGCILIIFFWHNERRFITNLHIHSI